MIAVCSQLMTEVIPLVPNESTGQHLVKGSPNLKLPLENVKLFLFIIELWVIAVIQHLGWLECVARQAPPPSPHPVPGSWIIWHTVECEDISALDCFTANCKLQNVRTSWLPSFSSSSGRHSLKILLHWMSQRWYRPLDKISTNSSECGPVVFPTHLKARVNCVPLINT